MKRILPLFLEIFPYFGAAAVFFLLRAPLLPLWWPDFHSDFALVGIMAQHTKAGSFPIYFYGQNYMGGLEWLTAALFSRIVDTGPSVSLDVLRANSLLWWFAAGMAWVAASRRWSIPVSHLVGWLFAFGTLPLLQVSVLQELSPQALFFGALLVMQLLAPKGLLGRRGFLFGVVLGLAWWTNQGVVFFLLPALFLFQALPGRWRENSLVKKMLTPVRGLRWAYILGGILISIGAIIAIFGGLTIAQGGFRLKVPNGISLVRDCVLVLLALQFGRAFLALRANGQLREVFLPFWPAAAGFLLGFSPVWLGRIFGLFEKGYGVGLAIVPIWFWPSQLRALVAGLFEVLFSQQIWVSGAYLIVGFVGWRLGAHKRISGLLKFCLAVFLLNSFYVVFSDRSMGVPIRYLYPAFIALILAASTMAVSIPQVWARAICMALLMASSAMGAIQSRNYLVKRADDLIYRKTNLENVVKIFQGSGIEYCWGDYWSSYLLTYLTEQRTILSPHHESPAPQVRYKPYARALVEVNPACYLFREDESATAKIFFSAENPWVKK